MNLEVTLNCCMCGKKQEWSLEMPAGWSSRYCSAEDELGFCPDHAAIAPFSDSQCPGCVGGWGDCPLWKSFAYSKLELTDDDFRTLETGICPKRVNGTMMVERGEIKDVDLRDPPSAEGGKALAQAIREYVEKYHRKNDFQ